MINILFEEIYTEPLKPKSFNNQLIFESGVDFNSYNFYAEQSSIEVLKNRDIFLHLNLHLDIGKLGSNIFSDERIEFLSKIRNPKCKPESIGFNSLKENMLNCYDKIIYYAKNELPFCIWNHKTPASLCGLAFICDVLKDYSCPVFIFDIPYYEISSSNPKHIDHTLNYNEISVKHYSNYFSSNHLMSNKILNHYAKIWHKLLSDNSPLRSIINDKIISVPEDFYDFMIKDILGHTPINQRQLHSKFLEYHLPILWSAQRINKMIENREIEVIKDAEYMQDRIIKLK